MTEKPRMLYSLATLFLIIYGTFWCIGGLFYVYAGSLIQFPLQAFMTTSEDVMQSFFNQSSSYAWIYILIFSLFAIADMALSLIAAIFFALFRNNSKVMVMTLSIFFAGFCGTIVDITLLSIWHIIANSFPGATTVSLIPMWNVLGFIEYFSIWLSAIGFLAGALGFYLLFVIAGETKLFSHQWRYLTLIGALFSALSVPAIIYSMSGETNLLIGLLFLISTVIISPLWSFWTIFQLKKMFN